MPSTNSSRFLLFLLIATFVTTCILFAPYFSVFVLTLVFGVIFQPINLWLRNHTGVTRASVLTTLLVTLVIIGPVAFVVTQVAREAFQLLASLQNGGGTDGILALVENQMHVWFPWLELDLGSYVSSILTWVGHQAGLIFGSIATVTLNLFLAMIALSYWFKDSEKLRATVVASSPLAKNDTDRISQALRVSIHSVIRGKLVIAAIQGIIAGIGYVIFGVPNPILWATVTAVCALVPTFGTTIIFVPIIAYVAFTGDTGAAVGLSIWGLLAVGLIDNLWGPRLMSRGGNVHPFFILIAVLGGVEVFGPVGLFAGPLIVSFFFSVFEAYAASENKHVEA